MSENNTSPFEKMNNRLRNSITIRLITIGVLILLLMIPVSMVEGLIRERQYRQESAVNEVSNKWGEQQTIKGPILSIPYKTFTKVYETNKTNKYKLVESIEFAHFLPEKLNIESVISPELRHRGIYEILVYNSDINISGNFVKPDFGEWNIKKVNIIWKDAFISLGLSDLRSIQENISLDWNKNTYYFNPGIETKDVISNGISTRIDLSNIDSSILLHNFNLNIDINGSSNINFIPLGKTTIVNVNSTWKTPSFDGAFLPDSTEINDKGFSAMWKVLHLNRTYPQKFKGSVTGIIDSSFGVNLLIPVGEYQKNMRSAKYAAMFITLTFLIFFFVQILNAVRIHPIQYIIVGLALCIFYTLLIGLSEHIPFDISYLISSVLIVSLITFYCKNIFNNNKLTIVIGLLLSVLYLFIFSIIQMEDYALLMGSIGLFLIISIIMYLSRKINWYSIKSE